MKKNRMMAITMTFRFMMKWRPTEALIESFVRLFVGWMQKEQKMLRVNASESETKLVFIKLVTRK